MKNLNTNGSTTGSVFFCSTDGSEFMNSQNRAYQQKLEIFSGLLQQATRQMETSSVMSPNLLASK